MGAALSNAIKSIDGSSDSEKQTRDALNSLFALGESRNDAAFAKATSDAMKVYIPIQKILLQRQQIVASASSGQEGIVNGIKSAVGNLMQGQILDGINDFPRVTDILQNCLDVVLGASSGQISYNYTYAIIATDLGALLRLDVDVYSFELQSKGLQNHAKNMTAITSLISTVNPQQISMSDLRGIVSLSYGASPAARQQEIFELCRQAWEMDRKLAIGQSLSQEDRATYRSLLKPSVYEQQTMRTSQAVDGLDSLTVSPSHKVDRLVLKKAFAKHTASNGPSLSSVTNNNNSKASGPGVALNDLGAGQMADIYLYMELTDMGDDDWFAHMSGALSGFNVDGTFKYIDVTGGRSGTAVSFHCQINSDVSLFDLGIQYVHDHVIPKIKAAPYLSSIVNQIGIQYSHPSVGNTGMITIVTYLTNNVVNRTTDIVTFVDPEGKNVLVLSPGANGVLDGPVGHIEASAPPPSEERSADPGTGDGETGGGDAAAPPTGGVGLPPPTRRWVTYDGVVETNITKSVSMDLRTVSPQGYQLTFFYDHDKAYSVNYTSLWESVAANPTL